MKFLKKTESFFQESKRRNPLLFNLSLILTLLFLLFLATFWICGNPPVSEICFWLKPFKFSLSFAVYVFTLSWLMEYIRPKIGDKRLRRISIGIIVLVVMKMGILFFQSVQYSDFFSSFDLSDQTTAHIAKTLSLMGNIVISITSALVLYIAIQFFRKVSLRPSSYLLGIRAGFVMFISSCILGFFLLLNFGPSPPDHQSFGFPFTKFQTARDNLISIHFFGIHALQFLPILGFYSKGSLSNMMIYTILFGYLGIMFFFLVKAV